MPPEQAGRACGHRGLPSKPVSEGGLAWPVHGACRRTWDHKCHLLTPEKGPQSGGLLWKSRAVPC